MTQRARTFTEPVTPARFSMCIATGTNSVGARRDAYGIIMHNWQWKKYWASTAGSVAVVAQVVLWIIWGFGEIAWLALGGFALWWVAVVFAWVPIFQLKRRGGVAKGASYVKTTVLVDTGIYAIVRHPQFISWPMFSAALMLMVQHWLAVALGVVSIVLFSIDFRHVDQGEIDKFGDAYRDYMKRVPGWNPVVGVLRLIRRKTSSRRAVSP